MNRNANRLRPVFFAAMASAFEQQQELWEEHGMLAPRDVLAHLGECCMHGRSSQPPLPYPAAIDMMLGEVLPWLLARDGTSDDDSDSVTTQLEEPFDDEEGDSDCDPLR